MDRNENRKKNGRCGYGVGVGVFWASAAVGYEGERKKSEEEEFGFPFGHPGRERTGEIKRRACVVFPEGGDTERTRNETHANDGPQFPRCDPGALDSALHSAGGWRPRCREGRPRCVASRILPRCGAFLRSTAAVGMQISTAVGRAPGCAGLAGAGSARTRQGHSSLCTWRLVWLRRSGHV